MDSNSSTAMIADCQNWYKSLKWWEKWIVNRLKLRSIYYSAYTDGWDSLHNLLSQKEPEGCK